MSNEGKIVKIHYTGTLDDGEKFDSSYDHGEPIEFKCMAGSVIKGFDDAVVDMSVGDKKTIHLEPNEAYGEYDEKLVMAVPVENVPNASELPIGESIYLQGPDGMPIPANVISVDDKEVRLDLNHPLAGKPLNFELELVEVKDA